MSASSSAAPLPPSIPSAAVATGSVRPRLRACFADQIHRDPTTGTVNIVVSYDVGGDGKVRGVMLTRRDGADDQTVACMTAAAREVVFEKPLDGEPATVNAPYNFHAVRHSDAAAPFAAPSVQP